MKFLFTIVLALLVTPVFAERTQNELAAYLQDISVTIKSDRSQGSGVIVTREIKFAKDSKPERVNFVWTAAHVVDNLRGTRSVINSQGQSRTVVQFKDASIVQELIEGGRRVGELKMDAKVIKYSDSDNGQDLALLMIRKRGFVNVSAEFHTGEPRIVPVGTRLYHVGSLHGQVGANSLTSGIISQVGRVINLGKGDGTIFDQTTASAFPGSSGGGVFIADTGLYCGMLVRGTGETFNLIVPIRRMIVWAKKVGVEWALDSSIDPPYLEDILNEPVEDIGVSFTAHEKSQLSNKKYNLKFMIGKLKLNENFNNRDGTEEIQ